MRPFSIVEVDLLTDHLSGEKVAGQFMKVVGYIIEGAPQAFDEDVDFMPASTIDGDRDLGGYKNGGEVKDGELASWSVLNICVFRIDPTLQKVS